MRVLFVISTLGKGGAERVMSVLANELSKSIEVTVLKFDDSKPFYEISDKVKVFSLKSGVGDKGIVGNFKKRLSKVFKIRKFIKENKFDAIIPFLDSTNILVLTSNLGLKNKVIVSEHTNHKFIQNPVLKFLRRIMYSLADGIVMLTKFDWDYYKFVKNRAILPNPMFDFKESVLNKDNLILSAGRLISHKGFDSFLRSIALVDKELLKGWQVVIAGDGEERANLENMAKDLGLDIKFVGFVKAIENYYKSAKIVAVNSKKEGFCNILMESIYFNCARISTDCIAGPSELINDGVDGFLCKVDDEKEFASKLEILLKDDSLRDKFTQNANLRKDEFRAQNIAKKWLEFIEICIKG